MRAWSDPFAVWNSTAARELLGNGALEEWIYGAFSFKSVWNICFGWYNDTKYNHFGWKIIISDNLKEKKEKKLAYFWYSGGGIHLRSRTGLSCLSGRQVFARAAKQKDAEEMLNAKWVAFSYKRVTLNKRHQDILKKTNIIFVPRLYAT